MNRYGRQAQEAWARSAPRALAQMKDPETYFTELGETLQRQVDLVAQQLETRLDPQADYLDRVQGLTAARKQAEEQVMDELVWEPISRNPSGWAIREELETLIGDLPSPLNLTNRQASLAATAAQRAEPGSTEAIWTEAEKLEVRLLSELHSQLEGLDPEALTEAEMEQTTASLRRLQAQLAALQD